MSDRPKDQDYMYKNEFIDELAEKLDISKEEANEIFNSFLEIFKETWSKKRTICIPKFGVFELRPMKERMGRNPMTMEEYVIPQMYKPIFRATKSLRDSINDNIRANEANLNNRASL